MFACKLCSPEVICYRMFECLVVIVTCYLVWHICCMFRRTAARTYEWMDGQTEDRRLCYVTQRKLCCARIRLGTVVSFISFYLKCHLCYIVVIAVVVILVVVGNKTTMSKRLYPERRIYLCIRTSTYTGHGFYEWAKNSSNDFHLGRHEYSEPGTDGSNDNCSSSIYLRMRLTGKCSFQMKCHKISCLNYLQIDLHAATTNGIFRCGVATRGYVRLEKLSIVDSGGERTNRRWG